MSEEDDYEIGYRRPPRKNQFAKKVSGNKKGRPKGARNKRPSAPEIDVIISQEAARPVEVRADGVLTKMPTIRAIIRSVNVAAIKGDPRAQRLALEAITGVQRREIDRRQHTFTCAAEYKFAGHKRIEYAEKHGLPPPDFVVHPDKIHLDPVAGEVSFDVASPQQEKALVTWLNFRHVLIDEIDGTVKWMKKHGGATIDDIDSLLWAVKTLKLIETKLGTPFLPVGDGNYDFDDLEISMKSRSG